MLTFYYHGLMLSSKSPAKYNRYIVKINNLIDGIKNESNMKALHNYDFTLIRRLSKTYSVIIEISNNDWNINIYNLEKQNFIDFTKEYFDFNSLSVSQIERIFQRIAGASIRKEIAPNYTNLSDDLFAQWKQYIKSIPNDLKVDNVLQMNYTDNIKTNYDLEQIINKIDEDFETNNDDLEI